MSTRVIQTLGDYLLGQLHFLSLNIPINYLCPLNEHLNVPYRVQQV